MKVILEIEIPDEALQAEGMTAADAVAEFQAIRDELSEGTPEGFKVTLRLEA